MKTTRFPDVRQKCTAIMLFSLVLWFAAASTAWGRPIDGTHKWAWGTNIGWINHKAFHEQTAVYSDHLEGYAWSENIGWIRLGTHLGGGTHTYLNTTADNYGVNRDGSGNLSGFGWSANAGWVNFNPTHGGVRISRTTGDFSGHAWAENIGWIKFSGTADDDTDYKVKLSNSAPGSRIVTYHGNGNTGGDVPVDGNTYAENDQVIVLGNTGGLVKSGSGFAGWNTRAGGGGSQYAPGATFSMPAVDVDLYAQWSSSAVEISPLARIHAPEAFSGRTVTVTADTGAHWTASSNAAWIMVTNGADGTGNGTVSYNLDPNGSPAMPRTGSICIADKVFTVTQGTYHWRLAQGSGTGCQGRIIPTGGPFFIQAGSRSATGDIPEKTFFPCGLLDFKIINVPHGDNVTLTINTTADIPVGSLFYKYDSGTYTPYENVTGLDDGDNQFTLTLTDGGAGDQDKSANQEIIDTGGIGVGGSQPIPTLSEWGMIILGLMLLGASLVRMRRKQTM